MLYCYIYLRRLLGKLLFIHYNRLACDVINVTLTANLSLHYLHAKVCESRGIYKVMTGVVVKACSKELDHSLNDGMFWYSSRSSAARYALSYYITITRKLERTVFMYVVVFKSKHLRSPDVMGFLFKLYAAVYGNF